MMCPTFVVLVWYLSTSIAQRTDADSDAISQCGEEIGDKFIFDMVMPGVFLPPTDTANPYTPVSIRYFWHSLLDINSNLMVMSMVGRLALAWNNPHSAWVDTNCDLAHLRVPASSQWVPDFEVDNSANGLEDVIAGSDLLVLRNGDVYWEVFRRFRVLCALDNHLFPWDFQKCEIGLLFEHKNISLTEDWLSLSSGAFQVHSVWDLVGYQQQISIIGLEMSVIERNIRFNHTFVQLQFLLQRKSEQFVLDIVMPIFFMIIAMSVTFVLPADSGEKMTLTLTCMLALFVQMITIAQVVPADGATVPLISQFLTLTTVAFTGCVCGAAFVERMAAEEKRSIKLFAKRDIRASTRRRTHRSTDGCTTSRSVNNVFLVLYWAVILSTLGYFTIRIAIDTNEANKENKEHYINVPK